MTQFGRGGRRRRRSGDQSEPRKCRSSSLHYAAKCVAAAGERDDDDGDGDDDDDDQTDPECDVSEFRRTDADGRTRTAHFEGRRAAMAAVAGFAALCNSKLRHIR